MLGASKLRGRGGGVLATTVRVIGPGERLAVAVELIGQAGRTSRSRQARSPVTNLPAYTMRVVGRERELELIRSMILEDDARLITLTGAGGIGKTRLAIECAADIAGDFPDGVHVVWLAPVADPEVVATAIAQTLGVTPRPGHAALGSLTDYLRHKRLLLVMDNFEHLTAAGLMLAELLMALPDLYVLVTSRAVLHLYGERVVTVPPLALPDRRTAPTAHHLIQFESVCLFVERARAAQSDFALTDANASAVGEICQRLDGLPLALELAASRLRVLPLAALFADMNRRLPVLTGGPRDMPARQRTLRDTIAWSYDLLGPDEQTLFRRLAVFQGCTPATAEQVCCSASLDSGSTSIAVPPLRIDLPACLGTLVDNSLLCRDQTPDGQAWYATFETIREYALEQLSKTDECDAIYRRHALAYVALAEAADLDMTGRGQTVWIARFEQEYPNLLSALVWCEERGYAEPAFRLAVALWWFWAISGRSSIGRDRLLGLLARFGPRSTPARYVLARARAAKAAANLAAFHGDYVGARRLLEEALQAFREYADAPSLQGTLQTLGWVASRQGDHTAALAYLEEGLDLARAHGQATTVALTLFNLAYVVHEGGDYAAASRLLEESLSLKREAGLPGSMGIIQITMGMLALEQGDTAKARTLCEDGLHLCREAKDVRGAALGLADLAVIAMAEGDYSGARAAIDESIALHEEVGDPVGLAFVLERAARLAAVRGQSDMAMQLAGAAAGIRERSGAPLAEDAQLNLDNWLAPASQSLGEARAAEAWATGSKLSLAQAVRVAVTLPQSVNSHRSAPNPGRSDPLTRREREVAALIARGYTNQQIGTALVITEATVASHVVHILAKLDMGSRAQVAVWAAEHALLTTP
jgi:predicted ATPase/DNA-binding CsgD family transcriptional regulator/Tfp pilus assembly protein PilF